MYFTVDYALSCWLLVGRVLVVDMVPALTVLALQPSNRRCAKDRITTVRISDGVDSGAECLRNAVILDSDLDVTRMVMTADLRRLGPYNLLVSRITSWLVKKRYTVFEIKLIFDLQVLGCLTDPIPRDLDIPPALATAAVFHLTRFHIRALLRTLKETLILILSAITQHKIELITLQDERIFHLN